MQLTGGLSMTDRLALADLASHTMFDTLLAESETQHDVIDPRELQPIGFESVVNIIAKAFLVDPPDYFFVLDWYDLPDTHVITVQDNVRWFNDLLRPIVDAGAVVAQVGAADGVIVGWGPNFSPPSELPPRPPHLTASPPSCTSSNLAEFVDVADSIKAGYLCGRRHWYIFLVARNTEMPEGMPSVSTALIAPVKRWAQHDNVPVWLEATTEKSRNIYAALGFAIVVEFRVGIGRVDESGKPCKGGEGVRFWAMVYEP